MNTVMLLFFLVSVFACPNGFLVYAEDGGIRVNWYFNCQIETLVDTPMGWLNRMAENWLSGEECIGYTLLRGDIDGTNIVDLKDFNWLARNWPGQKPLIEQAAEMVKEKILCEN